MNTHYDLIVAGGGLSGVAAAVSAAREGLRVLLVERNGSLGGAMSHNLVFPFMPYWTVRPEDQSRQFLSVGIFGEMNERHKKYTPETNHNSTFHPEYYKILLDDMVTEAGVEVLFHGTVCSVKTEDRRITGVSVATVAGVLEFSSSFFVDATGNGDLFALAGCDFQLGRESDGLCQPMTTCFRLSNVDVKQFRQELPALQEEYRRLQAEGTLQNPRENILVFNLSHNVLHFNTTRVIKCDPTNAFDVSRAEIEARRQVYEMVHFLESHSKACENARLISIAPEIGIRESRKLRGVHILTAEELKALTPFEDSIALGNYDIDIHNPSGSGTSHYYFPHGDYYRIPYRSLLPKEYDNLLVAGRCISTTHEAQASVRIMPICACLGEAAGTAIAVAHKTDRTTHTLDVGALQELLRSHGAVL